MFYVYVYLDTRRPGKYIYEDLEFNYEPIYVGKGSRCRYLAHLNIAKSNKRIKNVFLINKIKKILLDNKEPEILIIKRFSDEKEALLYEMFLIKLIGRHDLKEGTLCNFTDGGERGCNKNKETINKMKLSKLGSKNPNYGHKMSDTKRTLLSLKIKEHYINNDHPMKNKSFDEFFGLERSAEIKSKLKGRKCPMEGKFHTNAAKEKMSIAKLGDKNPNKNGLSESHKQKISESLIGREFSEETKQKMKVSQSKPRPTRKITYKVVSPTNEIFILVGNKELFKFISNNKLSKRKILECVNKGVITEKDFKYKRKSLQINIGWEITKKIS